MNHLSRKNMPRKDTSRGCPFPKGVPTMISSLPTLRQALLASLAAVCVLLAAPLAAQPANQFCANAVTIPAAGPFPFSAAAVNTSKKVFDQGGWTYPCLTGKSFTLPLDPNAVSRTVWYSFTPAVTDTYRIDTAGSTPAGEYDTILEVYTGICG